MLISEISVYEFLKEKVNLSDSEAKKYAKELAYAEERLHTEISETISQEMKNGDFATRKDIKDLELSIKDLELSTKNDIKNLEASTKNDIKNLKVRMEKGFKETIVWVIGFLTAIIGLAVALIKFFP